MLVFTTCDAPNSPYPIILDILIQNNEKRGGQAPALRERGGFSFGSPGP